MSTLGEIKGLTDQYAIMLLLPIVMAGIVVRLRNFTKKGIFTYDEAAYYREMIAASSHIGFVVKNARKLAKTKRDRDCEQRRELVAEYDAIVYTHYAYYKAWHVYLVWIASRLKVRPDVALAIPSVVMGALIPIAAYAACAVVFGNAAGLVAAVTIAVNGLHVLHSRSGGPESGMAFAFMLALLFSMTHKAAMLDAGSGFLFTPVSLMMLAGYGFCIGGVVMFHPFWAGVIPGVIGAGEIVFALASGVMSPVMTGVALLIVFASAVLCIFVSDLPFIISYHLFPESKIIPHSKKIIEWIGFNFKRLGDMLGKDDKEGARIPAREKYGFYPSLIRETSGCFFSVSIVAGCCFMLFNGGPLDYYILTIAAIFLAFMSVIPWKATRGIIIFIPVMVILSTVAIVSIPVLVAIPVLLIIAAYNIAYSMKVTSQISGIYRAVQFIRGKGEDSFLCTSFPFSLLYGRKDKLYIPTQSYRNIEHAYLQEGIYYLIIEHHVLFPAFTSDDFLDKVQANIAPVFTAQDPCVTFLPLFWEAEYYWTGHHIPKGTNVTRWNNFRTSPSENDRLVKVYDLREVFSSEAIMREIHINKIITHVIEKIKNDEFKECVPILKKATAMYPDNALFRFFLGFCHVKMGRPKWGVRDLAELAQAHTLPEEYHEMCLDILAAYQDAQ